MKVWSDVEGKLCRTLEGHGHPHPPILPPTRTRTPLPHAGHWVNSLALSTDYAIRVGGFDHHGQAPEDFTERVRKAKERYDAVVKGRPERPPLTAPSPGP